MVCIFRRRNDLSSYREILQAIKTKLIDVQFSA